MTRVGAILSLLLPALSAKAQVNQHSLLNVSSENNHTILYDGFGSFNNSGFQNEFVYEFYEGSFLDSSIIHKTSGNLSQQNNFGADIDNRLYGVIASNWCKKQKIGIYFGIRDLVHIDGEISKGLFDFVFKGNRPFESNTLDFGSNRINSFIAQSFELGTKISNGENSTLVLGVSLLRGEKFLSFSSSNTSIYTSEYGDSMHLNLYYKINQSGSNSKNSWNGTGAALNVLIKKELQENTDFSLGFYDLGIINWKNISTVSVDTSMSIVPYFIENPFTNFEYKPDTSFVANLYPKKTSSITKMILPAVFFANISLRHHKLFKLTLGLNQRIYSNYKLYSYVEESVLIRDRFSIGLRYAVGGYGKVSTGLTLGYQGKKLLLKLRAENIEGIALPDKQSGLTGNLIIGYNF